MSRKAASLLGAADILLFAGLTNHSHNRQRVGSVLSPQGCPPFSKRLLQTTKMSMVAIAYPFDQVLEVTTAYPKPCCFPHK